MNSLKNFCFFTAFVLLLTLGMAYSASAQKLNFRKDRGGVALNSDNSTGDPFTHIAVKSCFTSALTIGDIPFMVEYGINEWFAMELRVGVHMPINIVNGLSRATYYRPAQFHKGWNTGIGLKVYLNDNRTFYCQPTFIYRNKQAESITYESGIKSDASTINASQTLHQGNFRIQFGIQNDFFSAFHSEFYFGVGLTITDASTDYNYSKRRGANVSNNPETVESPLYYENGQYFIPNLHIGYVMGGRIFGK
jgi:hypothetical protein